MTNKFYNIELKLYIETESYDFLEVLEKVKKLSSYAYILHNNDIGDDGKPVKDHIHCMCFFPSQHSLSAYSKNLGVPVNDIQIIDNRVGAIQYLVHKNNPEKAQYNVEDIKTNIPYLERYFNRRIETETQEMYLILTFINNYDGILTLSKFYNYVMDNDCWSTYRRSAYSINMLIKEHNELY